MVVLTAGGCSDSSPTSNEGQPDEAAFARLAEAALEVNDAEGTPLPSLHNLLRRTFEAIRAHDGNGGAVRLLKAGQTLQAIVAVLGPEVAVESLTGVRAALDRLQAHVGDRPVPDRVQKTINRAEALWTRGTSAMAGGNPVGALGAALASAELIRSLSPRYQARRAIERATRALGAAVRAVGDGPTTEERTALQKARRFRNAAIDAFEGRKYRKAWTYARNSLELSLAVLKGRTSG
jgi:hypothetical protein